MFKVTRYFVRAGTGEAGQEGPFREEDRALALGRAIARRGGAARVFSVTGEPVFDLWDEPRLLAAYPSLPVRESA